MGWLAALFFAAWIISMGWCANGLVRVIRYWEKRDRYDRWRQGRCLECGYDVRATIKRCPECGTRLPIRRKIGDSPKLPDDPPLAGSA